MMYIIANHRLTSKSNTMTPSQFPAEKLLDIAYQLGFVIAGWIEELANNIPAKGVSRKPSGHGTWAPKVHEMVEKRKKFERESNRLGLEGIEAHRYLLKNGVVVLDCGPPKPPLKPPPGVKFRCIAGDIVATRGGPGKKPLAGVGPLEGVSAVGVGTSSSAPDQRKPSKRPEMRISHSCGLMSEMVWRRSCVCGYLTRYAMDSASRGAVCRR